MEASQKPKLILSIETSCDETAIALLEATGDILSPRFSILGNALYSQAQTHSEYGGVFPMLAKREHAKNLVPLLTSALQLAQKNDSHHILKFTDTAANLSEEKLKNISIILEREADLYQSLVDFLKTQPIPQIDAIAVTQGPGLEPALWVGISFAKALSYAWNIPVIPINHMEGHIVSVLMGSNTHQTEPSADQEGHTDITPSVQFPALALLISGGHTELVHINNWHDYKVIGRTRDDAVGEAFDKAARILGLSYPGGPEISKHAARRRQQQPIGNRLSKDSPYKLPRPMISSDNLDFSFSGIKTAVLYMVQKLKQATPELSEETISAICQEFEDAVTEVLIEKTRKALIQTQAQTLILGGGVVANSYIRKNFEQLIQSEFSDVRLYVPSVDMSTDNAVMIAVAGYLHVVKNPTLLTEPVVENITQLRAQGNLSL